MATGKRRPSIVVVVGPTASGKSGLAMRLAEDFNGEIISADSLTIYRGMDIGTAKPTKADRVRVRHWAIDILGPRQRFTAAQFKDYAQAKIKEIQARGHLPIVVGGTGLYVDALVFDFGFGGQADPNLRRELEALDVGRLQALISDKGYKMPHNRQNKRHLIRVIERQGKPGQKAKQPAYDAAIIGLMPAPDDHRSRISQRVEEMFNEGLVAETGRLIKQYGADSLRAKAAVAYAPVIDYLDGNMSLEQAKDRLKTLHWQYARRQKTWFKRDPFIVWFDTASAAYQAATELLNT